MLVRLNIPRFKRIGLGSMVVDDSKPLESAAVSHQLAYDDFSKNKRIPASVDYICPCGQRWRRPIKRFRGVIEGSSFQLFVSWLQLFHSRHAMLHHKLED